jgi:hypothetical protein
MMLVDSEWLRDSRNARPVLADHSDIERPRLIVLPPAIAPVVASPQLVRRRPRRILSLSSAGTLASLAIITRETIGHVTHLLRRFG